MALQGGAEAVAGLGHPALLNSACGVRLLARTDHSWPWLQQLHQYTSSVEPWAHRDPVKLPSIKPGLWTTEY